MSVRPDQRRGGERDVIEFGIAAFDASLNETEIQYPINSGELIAKLGDPEIPVDAHGNTITLSAAMEEVQQAEFGSERELQNALHPVFESYRTRGSNRMWASVRALLPF